MRDAKRENKESDRKVEEKGKKKKGGSGMRREMKEKVKK